MQEGQFSFEVPLPAYLMASDEGDAGNLIRAPMTGKLVKVHHETTIGLPPARRLPAACLCTYTLVSPPMALTTSGGLPPCIMTGLR